MRTLLKPTTQVEHAAGPRAETSDRRKYTILVFFLEGFDVEVLERYGSSPMFRHRGIHALRPPHPPSGNVPLVLGLIYTVLES